jgi:hypothetical protein
VRRRLRDRAGSRSGQSFGRSSAVERREADLFFADLAGPAADWPVESVREETRSAEHREADLFWMDLLGWRPTWPGQRQARGASRQSTELRQRGEETAFAEQPPLEWAESDDADPSSLLGEAFGSDHVRISLRNDDGTPAAGVAFRARFRDRHIVNGTLNAAGEATIADHTHGDVQVTFPGLPAANWEISSFGGSGG